MSADIESRPVTVRLNLDLYEMATEVSQIQGVPIRELIESGLRSKVEQLIKDGGEDLRIALKAVATYRHGLACRR